jgi:hypothetical protein
VSLDPTASARAVGREEPGARPRTALDLFLDAVPFATAALIVLAILFWEAATRSSPTVFVDELKWAQLSRSIADTGHAALRGEPSSFKSLYPYLIAPLWWFHATQTSYTAIKYVNEVVMALAAIPTYLLARRLVGPRAAAVAAIGTLCTTAYFYAPLLLPEVLAYPVFALCAYASVRALSGDGRRWTVTAIVLCVVAVLVRTQLMVTFGSLALAAIWLWLVGPRGRRLRRGWSTFDHLGAALLAIGALVVVNRVVGNHSDEWRTSTQGELGRMWSLSLQAFSALAIGLGLLPLMGGVASLWVPERRADPRWRAFAAYLGASILTFGLYTAVKATYLSLHFGTLVEERNLIYLQPLLLIGTVVVLTARRPSVAARLAGVAVTAFLVLYYGYQLGYPYLEAPGYGIAAMANRSFRWTQTDIRWALAVACVVGAGVLLWPFLRRAEPAARAALAIVAVGVAAWMLAAEVTSARGSEVSAKQELAGLPTSAAGLPLDWVDEYDGHHDATYLGQKEPNIPLGVWLIEFWNRTVKNVYTIDGSAPGPGPTTTPQLEQPDGSLSNDPDQDWVLQDNGVQMLGKDVAGVGALQLVQIPSHPWRLEQAIYNVTDDGWSTPPLNATETTSAESSWAYFGDRRGTVEVDVSRKQFNNQLAPKPHVTIRVGPVALNEQGQPVVRQPTHVVHVTFPNGTDRSFAFAAQGPVAVQVTETPTFRLTDYGGQDPRWLGVGVGFRFTPTR